MIRFFVSSTFEDMAAERELLHKKISPRINAYAQAKGEYVEFCDLRWGIDTSDLDEEDILYRIIDVCMEVIDECNGGVIAFLGDRYGTIPRDGRRMQEMFKKYGISGQDEKISITHFELEHAISSMEGCQTLCYFRNVYGHVREYDDQMKEKRIRLREWLISQKDSVQCFEYHAGWDEEENEACDLEKLEEQLFEDLKRIIDEKTKQQNTKNWIQEELRISNAVMERNSKQKAGKGDFKQKVSDEIFQNKKHLVYIYGESGSGKSTVMANLCEKIKEHMEVRLIACGYGARSKTYQEVIAQIIYLISGKVHDNFRTVQKAMDRLESEIKKYEHDEGSGICILLDAVDKLSDTEQADVFLQFFDNLELNKIHFVVSGQRKPEVNFEHLSAFAMEPLTKEDISAIFHNDMQQTGGWAERLITEIQLKRNSHSPLYVAHVIYILKMNLSKIRGKGNDEIFAYFQELIRELPEDIYELCYHYLFTAGKEYLKVQNFQKYLQLIAAVEHGISKNDIAHLVDDWDELEFYRYYLYLEKCFLTLLDGRIVFSHDIMAEAVKRAEREVIPAIRNEEIYPYLKNEMDTDAIHLSDGIKMAVVLKDEEYVSKLFERVLAVFVQETYLGKEKNEIIMQLVQNLWTACEELNVLEWFQDYAEKHFQKTREILYHGIRYDSQDSYARIIPAQKLGELFLQRILRMEDRKQDFKVVQQRLRKWMEQLDEQQRLDIVIFLAEYVSAYEVISKVHEGFPYEYVVYEELCGMNFPALKPDEQLDIFRRINYVFYSNNKVLGEIGDKEKKDLYSQAHKTQAMEISQGMIRWFDQYIREKFDESTLGMSAEMLGKMKDQEALFLSNIGQYYNAVKDFEKGKVYRGLALKNKLEQLIDCFPERADSFKSFCGCISETTIMDAKFHEDFWHEEIVESEAVFGEIKAVERRQRIAKMWSRVAVSYRTIATDCYYIPDTPLCDTREKKRDICSNGVKFHKICILLQQASLCETADINKEIAVSYIRLQGLLVREYSFYEEISLAEEKYLENLIKEASKYYQRYAIHDKTEGDNLRKNISNALKLPLKEPEVLMVQLEKLG